MIIPLNKASILSKIICGKREGKNNYIYTYISIPVPIAISIYKDKDENTCKCFSLLQIKQEMGKMYLGAIKKKFPSQHTKRSREKCETTHPNLNSHPTGMHVIFPFIIGRIPFLPISITMFQRSHAMSVHQEGSSAFFSEQVGAEMSFVQA